MGKNDNYFPLHVHSHFSILDGLSKPADIANRCKEIGVNGCALTDHGNVAGAVKFMQAMNKHDLKPILGCEFYINDEYEENKRQNSHLLLLAKNKKGWHKLLKIISEANTKDNYYYVPRLTLDQLGVLINNTDDIIGISGHIGSTLSNCMFADISSAYNCQTAEDVKKFIYQDYKERAKQHILLLSDIFGKNNFFIEIQLIDYENSYMSRVVAKILRDCAKELQIPCVATPDAHYARHEDCYDQRVLLCSKLNTTFRQIEKNGETALNCFFTSNNYHIPTYEEMQQIHTQDELANTIKIADMCEDYSILNKPILPKFPIPKGETASSYMRKLCRCGWKQKYNQIKQTGIPIKKYGERFEYEFNILDNAGLSDYFLIVKDIIDHAKQEGQLIGVGRGSAAGSLILYLLGVTDVDPLKYNLLFERFYNASRNIPQHVNFEEYPFLKSIGI